MAHHKRRRPKHQRAGCLMCKPYKDERVSNARESQAPRARKRREAAEQKLKEANE